MFFQTFHPGADTVQKLSLLHTHNLPHCAFSSLEHYYLLRFHRKSASSCTSFSVLDATDWSTSHQPPGNDHVDIFMYKGKFFRNKNCCPCICTVSGSRIHYQNKSKILFTGTSVFKRQHFRCNPQFFITFSVIFVFPILKSSLGNTLNTNCKILSILSFISSPLCSDLMCPFIPSPLHLLQRKLTVLMLADLSLLYVRDKPCPFVDVTFIEHGIFCFHNHFFSEESVSVTIAMIGTSFSLSSQPKFKSSSIRFTVYIIVRSL